MKGKARSLNRLSDLQSSFSSLSHLYTWSSAARSDVNDLIGLLESSVAANDRQQPWPRTNLDASLIPTICRTIVLQNYKIRPLRQIMFNQRQKKEMWLSQRMM